MNKQKKILLYLHDKDLQGEIYNLFQQTNYFNPTIIEKKHSISNFLDNDKYQCLVCDSKFNELVGYLPSERLIRYESNILIYLISDYKPALSDRLHSNFIFFHIKPPIQFREFVLSIEKNLQIIKNRKNKKIIFGDLIFYPHLKKIVNHQNIDIDIKLTDKETAIIEYLSKEENIIVSKDVLLKEVWGYNEFVDTHTLETHIYKLRKKIEIDHKRPEYLMNEEGGYRLKLR